MTPGAGECQYDPRKLLGKPIGMLHCPTCGVMVVAGFPHPPPKKTLDFPPTV